MSRFSARPRFSSSRVSSSSVFTFNLTSQLHIPTMARKPAQELSEYERKRQETIAKNQALLRELQLSAAEAGLAPAKRKRASSPSSASKKTKNSEPKPKKEPAVATRTSSRLRGIIADSEVARQKAEEQREARQAAERLKKQRISDDFSFGDVLVSGQHWNNSGNFLIGVGPAEPNKRTFTAQHVKQTSDKELRALRERMSNLELWEDVEPNRIKITPERIYAMTLHPTTEKPLVFAGDKLGNLGIFDSAQSKDETVNGIAEDDEDDDSWKPSVTIFKPHTRTISAMQFSSSDPNILYTSSYDSSLRSLDLQKGKAVEVYAPQDLSEDTPLSGVQLADNDPNRLYFATLEGAFGIHDVRTRSHEAEIYQLSEKKIGGFSLHPLQPHFVATASLDRTLKLWDLRKITGKKDHRMPALLGEHGSRLSVSHAAFNYAGQVATTSYDDTVKVHDFSDCASWDMGKELKEEQMKPTAVIPHNNQTGRWVTMSVERFQDQIYQMLRLYRLKAQWQLQPQDGIQRFVIGNMNRFVDIYTSKGEQLAQLGGDGITAVPAVARFHPTMDWVAAGTASGKLCLWM